MTKDEKIKLIRIVFICVSTGLLFVGVRGIYSGEPEWVSFLYTGFGFIFIGYSIDPSFFLERVTERASDSKTGSSIFFENPACRLLVLLGGAIIFIGGIYIMVS